MKRITYQQSGVDYSVIDPLKRLAQREGKKTVKNLRNTGFKEYPESRGESAYVIENKDSYLAFVEEGLGTKNLVADAMFKITGKTYYNSIAQDTVAMIINDLITVGTRPLTVLAYWAVGSTNWFKNKKRLIDLTKGWARACNLSGATWGGGETPTLSGIVNPETIDLAGAAFGIIQPKRRLALGAKLQPGDAIVLFGSSGIHANGFTLARKLAKKLPKGYTTKLKSGKIYGEALLKPTIIYAKLIQELFSAAIDIHYMANITGHGWRKIMRHSKKLTYRIDTIPPVPEILQFIIDKGPVDISEAYANFNMGAGFAIFISQKDIEKTIQIAKKNRVKAYHSGVVEKGKKQVIIGPLGITYSETSLQVKA